MNGNRTELETESTHYVQTKEIKRLDQFDSNLINETLLGVEAAQNVIKSVRWK